MIEFTGKRIHATRESCGPLCDLSEENPHRVTIPGEVLDTIRVPVDCDAIFKFEDHDAIREQIGQAPYTIPIEFEYEYTMQGRINVTRSADHYDEPFLGTVQEQPLWHGSRIETLKAEVLSYSDDNNFHGSYGGKSSSDIYRLIKQGDVVGKHVLVVGSMNPWLEAICLAAGAKHVTTLEYGEIISLHPQVSTIIPSDFRKMYLNGTLPRYDMVVTYSSLEHSGLGRYGDALNPWADIVSLARVWCVAKENAKLVIGVGPLVEKDVVLFNKGREYSKLRYSFLVSNWKMVDWKGSTQPDVFLLEKMPPL